MMRVRTLVSEIPYRREAVEHLIGVIDMVLQSQSMAFGDLLESIVTGPTIGFTGSMVLLSATYTPNSVAEVQEGISDVELVMSKLSRQSGCENEVVLLESVRELLTQTMVNLSV